MSFFLPAPHNPNNDCSKCSFDHSDHEQGRRHIRVPAREADEGGNKNQPDCNAQDFPGEDSVHDWPLFAILHL